jgi:uncharacterized membrane protein
MALASALMQHASAPALMNTDARPWVWGLFWLHLLAQPIYALLPPALVLTGTLVIVLSFTAFSFAHMSHQRGLAATLRFVVLCIVICGGLEVISVATGFPFGRYTYSGGLGPGIFGVPFLVPLCWFMMAYPVICLVESVARGWWRIPLAALALTAWDLFLDPQIVRSGLWVWLDPPFYAGIPLQNYFGWLLTAFILFLVWFHGQDKKNLNTIRLPRDHFEVLPIIAYIWTWFGSFIVNVFWWNEPLVGIVGGVGMAIFAVPMLLHLYKLVWLRQWLTTFPFLRNLSLFHHDSRT